MRLDLPLIAYGGFVSFLLIPPFARAEPGRGNEVISAASKYRSAYTRCGSWPTNRAPDRNRTAPGNDRLVTQALRKRGITRKHTRDSTEPLCYSVSAFVYCYKNFAMRIKRVGEELPLPLIGRLIFARISLYLKFYNLYRTLILYI